MRIYLDVCCYNRPFDDQLETRVRLEAEAILIIVNRAIFGEWIIIGSSFVDYEISLMTNYEKREKVLNVYSKIAEKKPLTVDIENFAKKLTTITFKPLDAFHVASAELSGANYFITTDMQIIKKYKGNQSLFESICINPISFLTEVT